MDTADALRQCIDTLLALPQRPDVVVLTGDLVDFGSEEEYRFLRGILETLPIPVRLMPGNHDSRDALRRVFPDHAYLFAAGDGDSPVHYRIDAGPLTLIVFDCTVPRHSGGRLEPDQLP